MNNRSKDMIDAHFSLTITLNPFIICTFRHNSHIKSIWVQFFAHNYPQSIYNLYFSAQFPYQTDLSLVIECSAFSFSHIFWKYEYVLIIRCLLIFLATVSAPFCCRKFQICLKILPEGKNGFIVNVQICFMLFWSFIRRSWI